MPAKDEFPTTFRDQRGREWDIQLTVRIVRNFCRENSIKLAGFMPHALDIGQLIDLAFMGTRHQARVQGLDRQESEDEFFESLEGPSFYKATDAAVNAIINFTLRTLPKEKRGSVATQIREAMTGIKTRMFGHGEKSSEPPPSPASESHGTPIALSETS